MPSKPPVPWTAHPTWRWISRAAVVLVYVLGAIAMVYAACGCAADHAPAPPGGAACGDARPEWRALAPEYPGDCFAACYGAPVGAWCGPETWGPCAGGDGVVVVGVCRAQCSAAGTCAPGFVAVGTLYGCYCAPMWTGS